jgi:hypothetical protein
VCDLAKNDRTLDLPQKTGILYGSYQVILTEDLVCLSQVCSTTANEKEQTKPSVCGFCIA